MSRRNRRRYIGSYREPTALPIEFPYTVANLEMLLAEGMRSDSLYTHQQIKQWADRFWWTQSEEPFLQRIAVTEDVQRAARIAQAIEMEWDADLANTYTLAELQQLDFSQFRLPTTCFTEWLERLRQISSPQEPK